MRTLLVCTLVMLLAMDTWSYINNYTGNATYDYNLNDNNNYEDEYYTDDFVDVGYEEDTTGDGDDDDRDDYYDDDDDDNGDDYYDDDDDDDDDYDDYDAPTEPDYIYSGDGMGNYL